MKSLFFIATMVLFIACNNSKKENAGTSTDSTTTVQSADRSTESSAVGTSVVSYSVADTVKTFAGSVLVQKDKSNVSPGNDLLAVVTANSNDGESFVVNFAFTPKPGVYPVVGLSLAKGNYVFGGILGGEPKLTDYKVNLTQCEDLGSNNAGGHKWRISGNIDGEVTINAMGIMKMDKTHPDDVKVNKISFTNLTFDDNWEQLLEEGMKKLKQ